MALFRLSVLRFRDFRFLGLAVAFNSLGMAAEQVVLGWLALELTNSPFMVGVALAVRAAPMLVVGIPAGVVADRVDRNRLLKAASAAQAATSATLGLVTLLGVVHVWHLLLVTFLAGCARALDQTARQSYIHDVVGGAGLLDGLAFIGLVTRAGGLVGSLLCGAVIARLGPGAAYLGVAAGYLGSVATLWPAGAVRRDPEPTAGTAWQSLVSFVTAVRHHRVLPLLMVMTAGSEALGFSHQTLLPSLARDVLRVGPEGLGAMIGARYTGGILGILAISGIGQVRANGALFLSVIFAFGASLVALGAAPGFAAVLLILVVANAVGALSDLLSQSLIQLSMPSGLHGRAGGAWVLSIGLGPLGQLQIGALASLLGVSLALALSGGALMVVAVGVGLLFPRLRDL